MNNSVTRRSFLKKTGLGIAVAASSYALPSFASNSPSNRLNIAIIGCGGRMQGLRSDLLKMSNVRIIAACDPFESRRLEYAQFVNNAYNGKYCKAVEDFRDVLADPDVDGIVVATPDHWHVPISIAAARAGKDMYVEKPLGLSMSRAAILQREIRKNNCIFQYGTQQHSSLSGRQAVELVQNEYVGKIQRCDVWCPSLSLAVKSASVPASIPEGFNYDLWLGPAKPSAYSQARVSNMGAWHCYDYALGFIAGWGAHPLDMLQWGLNQQNTAPVTYQGKGFWDQNENLYNTVRTWDIQMEYANGVTVQFWDQFTAEPIIKKFHPYFKGNGVIYHGTDGYICHSRGAAYVYKNGKYVRVKDINFDDFTKKTVQSPGHMKNFIESMISRKDPVSTIESAVHSDSMSHLGNVAVRSGKKLRYDPESLTITNHSDLNTMLTRPMRREYDIS